jgi:hypothetical protein
MEETENLIICLNYCVQDLETGYCLTCGRPPIPVTAVDLNPKTFAGISLKGMSSAANKTETPDETS